MHSEFFKYMYRVPQIYRMRIKKRKLYKIRAIQQHAKFKNSQLKEKHLPPRYAVFFFVFQISGSQINDSIPV